jgi:hypothetical protein
VESPIQWVVIFRFAVWTELKARHSCERAIIGDVLYDGVTGTAVGAIDERVAISPVIGVE